MIVTSSLTTALLLATAAGLPTSTTPSPLEPLKPAQWRDAGVGGTGCYWSPRANSPIRLAMADDKAVASIGGKVTVLSPGRGAGDLFPFTFDRWKGAAGKVTITVRKLAIASRIGTETLGSRTDLVIAVGRRRTVLQGFMECGS